MLDATIARIEQSTPSFNTLIFNDFSGARSEANKAENPVMSGAKLALVGAGAGAGLPEAGGGEQGTPAKDSARY